MSTQVKARYLLLAFLPYWAFYFLIQSYVTVSQYDLLTDIDQKIPFIPQFIWIYHSIIPVVALTATLLFQDKSLFFGLIFSIVFAGAFMCLSYILFPSFYPRELFVDSSTLSGWLIEVTRSIDGPHNTFPSGHVTYAWLLVFFVSLSQYTQKRLWMQSAYFLWASLITISTLTLKQHYLMDVFSGIVLATATYFLARRVFISKTVKLITINEQPLPRRSTPAIY